MTTSRFHMEGHEKFLINFTESNVLSKYWVSCVQKHNGIVCWFVFLQALYNQYLQFKETEIPPKEIDKSKIKHLYKLLEVSHAYFMHYCGLDLFLLILVLCKHSLLFFLKVWIEFGRIKLPQGYHPNDIEKEWGKLIISMLEREKMLRPEVERYASALLYMMLLCKFLWKWPAQCSAV